MYGIMDGLVLKIVNNSRLFSLKGRMFKSIMKSWKMSKERNDMKDILTSVVEKLDEINERLNKIIINRMH